MKIKDKFDDDDAFLALYHWINHKEEFSEKELTDNLSFIFKEMRDDWANPELQISAIYCMFLLWQIKKACIRRSIKEEFCYFKKNVYFNLSKIVATMRLDMDLESIERTALYEEQYEKAAALLIFLNGKKHINKVEELIDRITDYHMQVHTVFWDGRNIHDIYKFFNTVRPATLDFNPIDGSLLARFCDSNTEDPLVIELGTLIRSNAGNIEVDKKIKQL